MINGRAIDSLGLLVGMIVGAGMFAIPYVVSRAGLLLGSIYLLLGVSVVAVLHTLYGEVVYVIKERHRLPGYARLCLGACWLYKLHSHDSSVAFCFPVGFGCTAAY